MTWESLVLRLSFFYFEGLLSPDFKVKAFLSKEIKIILLNVNLDTRIIRKCEEGIRNLTWFVHQLNIHIFVTSINHMMFRGCHRSYASWRIVYPRGQTYDCTSDVTNFLPVPHNLLSLLSLSTDLIISFSLCTSLSIFLPFTLCHLSIYSPLRLLAACSLPPFHISFCESSNFVAPDNDFFYAPLTPLRDEEALFISLLWKLISWSVMRRNIVRKIEADFMTLRKSFTFLNYRDCFNREIKKSNF